MLFLYSCFFFFFKQKTAYEMRISDWSSDVCSSDLRKVDVAPYLGIDQVVVAPIQGGGDVLTYTNVTAGVTASIQTRRLEASADLQYAHSFGWGGDLSDPDVPSGNVSGQYGLARGRTRNAGGPPARGRPGGRRGRGG